MTAVTRVAARLAFPRSSGVLFGLGLGGFFDGIVFHQLLQWHHMFSGWYPAPSVENLQSNTFWDGVFHSATYLFFLAGLLILWRHARRPHFGWSTRELIGTILIGFGLFNLVEGLVSHQLLGIHHVNETVDRSLWIYWDIGFLAWGAIMLAAGWMIVREKEL
ncbi:DUF2243 domain-containing protein [Rhizobium bangladeshense]|uniref:DUF2243 domain-containing protein n=1 Tax=Rhizobium bangladeshense TaxID=1138189 RepID=A0ABS7LIR4_9HYPH|nr:DUF2243 domain-containing protein [Rhizobium bangladeshense]MBX4867250.1 DUF2243 domain-containing protein [Rhizobium bangladeshense]MBX4871541.1 DUF2243 domain-containing protein [Rhizobium bangladeshense]MBX4896977.1 DUF2243 domain-containing protein [Rhizobium bangladeshense]MBX4900984.1 DUF2243 domain-containing protein [Rhizobium bangladeshense]MBX4915693.1 DUF2243 domain-containing protein [Rhizobium bangladeshense]